MKPEVLQEFKKEWGPIETCIGILKSEDARLIAQSFVRLVRSAHTQEKNGMADMTLSKSTEYQDLLIKALETGAYEEVEEHIVKALNLPQEMQGIEYTESGRSQLAAVRSHVDVSRVAAEPDQFAGVFKSHYIGTAAGDLYRHLGQLQHEFVSKPNLYYAKFCSIVQSSGVGKSRALIELKDQGAIVVYLNIRSKEGGSPYPDRDEVPAKILTEGIKELSEKQYNRRCTAILTALLRVLKMFLLNFWKACGTRERVVEIWSQHMCDMTSNSRRIFFLEVEKVYEEIMKGFGKAPAQNNALPTGSTAQLNIAHRQSAGEEPSAPPMAPSSGAGPASTAPRMMTPSSSAELAELASKDQPGAASATKNPKSGDKTPRLHGESAMKEAYTQLIQALPEIFNTRSNSPSLVIAIDEAHPLRDPQTNFLPSHIFSRAVSALSQIHVEVPFWFVFASTTSKVADFSAPVDMYASLRVSIGGKLLFPPYYDFGWDQHAPAPSEVEPEKVARFSHIVRLGRPLWYSLADSNMLVSQVLNTAGQKLCGKPQFEVSDLHQALAVIGQRFLLDICLGSHDWIKFHHVGVSSHLRVCLWTSQDRKLMETSYPSEPLLSSAAAQLLYPLGVPSTSNTFLGVLGTALGQLKVAVTRRIVDQGLRGELVSRVLFLTAKDIAIRKYHESHATPPVPASASLTSMPEELLDCKPLPVIEYLTVLFGENKLDQKARDLFSGWYVNFSHWIGMDEIIAFPAPVDKPASNDNPASKDNPASEQQAEFNPVTEMQEWLLCLWTRTAAVQCFHRQVSFDKVIPMYKLRKPSEPRLDGDPNTGRVSFILISDKNRVRAATMYAVGNVGPKQAHLPHLGNPYIAILADLGAPAGNTIFQSRRRILQIHAFGSGPHAYPFLTGTMAEIVRDILRVLPRIDKVGSKL
ncbi:hypothetical protein FRC06_005070, partial [Ceratobasidium sp. 370]